MLCMNRNDLIFIGWFVNGNQFILLSKCVCVYCFDLITLIISAAWMIIKCLFIAICGAMTSAHCPRDEVNEIIEFDFIRIESIINADLLVGGWEYTYWILIVVYSIEIWKNDNDETRSYVSNEEHLMYLTWCVNSFRKAVAFARQ